MKGLLLTLPLHRILYLSDPETFAALTLLDRNWRKASETPQLYAYQLSRCPCFSATHNVIAGPFTEESLLRLKRQFVQEAKRNLFNVFTRPRRTNVSIISTTTGSSGGFPFGEAFDFVFSPLAQWCLAVSSSRVIVLDTASEEVAVKQELKVVRKPLSTCVVDNGSRLAVLSTDHKANVYDISDPRPRLLRSVTLDDPAHAVALTRLGEVLAVATEMGIEVHSLAENATLMDKRAVKCERVDCLSFSEDGTMLLGTTQGSKAASTVILSAPYFAGSAEHDMPQVQLISHMWTSQILFPNSSRDCSHATLLPRSIDHDANWALAYDRVFESFRAVRADDLRNGTTYFTGPRPRRERERIRSKSALVPSTLPSTTSKGELVAAGFLGSEIWLYGVPEDLDNPGVTIGNLNDGTNTDNMASGPAAPSASSPTGQEVENVPRWQVLVDKFRNVFAKGRRIAKISKASQVRWCSTGDGNQELQSVRERLIVAAPGGVSGLSDLDPDEMASADGGRLVVLDFDWSPGAGATKDVIIEVGNVEPQVLEEERTDMATEIALVRRRTVARRDGVPRSHVATVVDVLRPAGETTPPVPPAREPVGFGLDNVVEAPRAAPEPASPASVGSEGVALEEAVDALDGPYSHTSPRSRNTLYRSATAVEANRRRNPPPAPGANTGPSQIRRNDGTELPHESDADNWVPPPPPYSRHDDGPLPDHLHRAFASRDSNSAALGSQRRPTRSSTAPDSISESPTFRRRSSADVDILTTALTRWSSQGRGSNDRASLLSRSGSVTHNKTTSPPPLSPSASVQGNAPSRRPISSFEPLAAAERVALRPAPPLQIQITDGPMQASPSQSPITPKPNLQRASALTLSGSNLQQRLDYPLPPPPESERETESAAPAAEPAIPTVNVEAAVARIDMQPQAPPLSVPADTVSTQPSATPTTAAQTPISEPQHSHPAPHTAAEAHSPSRAAEPSAYQLNRLENRHAPLAQVSRTRTPPSPPPAALGAVAADPRARRASRFRAALRRATAAPAKPGAEAEGSSEEGKPSRLRSAFNASAPNLRRRPPNARLDTIQSAESTGRPPSSITMAQAGGVEPQLRPPIPPIPGDGPVDGGREERSLGRRLTRRFTRSQDPLRTIRRGEDAGPSGEPRRNERMASVVTMPPQLPVLEQAGERGEERRRKDGKCNVM